MSVMNLRWGLRSSTVRNYGACYSSLTHLSTTAFSIRQSRFASSKPPSDANQLNKSYQNNPSKPVPSSIQSNLQNLNQSRSDAHLQQSAEDLKANDNTKVSSTQTSTLASEILQVTSDFAEEGTSSHGRTGAKSKLNTKRQLTSNDKRRQVISRLLGSLFITLSAIWAWDQGREWDNEYEKNTLGQGQDGTRLFRFQARFLDLLDYFNKPAWNPLLPDPLPQPHGRPYTLLVDLDDLLVHSCWDREHGWRTAKRPGVNYFLSYLSQLYEIVIFTTQPAYTAAPICEKLDPYGYYAPYKLFKESCRTKGFIKTRLIKDLNYLGRDLKKVVYVDTEPEYYELHPNNGFIIPKWDGNPQDTGLIDLIPLLEAIVFNAVGDVRSVSKAYQGRDPVRAYAESEARQKKELVLKWHEDREKSKSWFHFDLRGLFGLKSGNPDEAPLLLVEKDRARAQHAYLQEQKYWKENEETFKKLMEEDRKKQMAEMKGSLLGFLTGQVGSPRPSTNESSSTDTPQLSPTS